jgi:hypothetical protein
MLSFFTMVSYGYKNNRYKIEEGVPSRRVFAIRFQKKWASFRP